MIGQRRNECALWTLCSITGQDYITASDLFASTNGGFRFGDLLNERDSLDEFCVTWFPSIWPVIRCLVFGTITAGSSGTKTEKGTGVVTFVDGASGRRHIEPYKDGRAQCSTCGVWYLIDVPFPLRGGNDCHCKTPIETILVFPPETEVKKGGM